MYNQLLTQISLSSLKFTDIFRSVLNEITKFVFFLTKLGTRSCTYDLLYEEIFKNKQKCSHLAKDARESF